MLKVFLILSLAIAIYSFPTETENFVCATAGQKCGSANEPGMFCCPGHECEDNFGGHGVCVVVHNRETSNFVCSGAGQPCNGRTHDSFFCCPGHECVNDQNGEPGYCIKVSNN